MTYLVVTIIALLILAGLYTSRTIGLKNFATKHGLEFHAGIPLLAGATVSGTYSGIRFRIDIHHNLIRTDTRRDSQRPELVYDLYVGNSIPSGILFQKKSSLALGPGIKSNIPPIDSLIYINQPVRSALLF